MILVDDDGPGLDPSLQESVLQRGVRADEAAPGSGLGLAIVRDLAELYGGARRTRPLARGRRSRKAATPVGLSVRPLDRFQRAHLSHLGSATRPGAS